MPPGGSSLNHYTKIIAEIIFRIGEPFGQFFQDFEGYFSDDCLDLSFQSVELHTSPSVVSD